MINALEAGYGWISILKEKLDHVTFWTEKKQIAQTDHGVEHMCGNENSAQTLMKKRFPISLQYCRNYQFSLCEEIKFWSLEETTKS